MNESSAHISITVIKHHAIIKVTAKLRAMNFYKYAAYIDSSELSKNRLRVSLRTAGLLENFIRSVLFR